MVFFIFLWSYKKKNSNQSKEKYPKHKLQRFQIQLIRIAIANIRIIINFHIKLNYVGDNFLFEIILFEILICKHFPERKKKKTGNQTKSTFNTNYIINIMRKPTWLHLHCIVYTTHALCFTYYHVSITLTWHACIFGIRLNIRVYSKSNGRYLISHFPSHIHNHDEELAKKKNKKKKKKKNGKTNNNVFSIHFVLWMENNCNVAMAGAQSGRQKHLDLFNSNKWHTIVLFQWQWQFNRVLSHAYAYYYLRVKC